MKKTCTFQGLLATLAFTLAASGAYAQLSCSSNPSAIICDNLDTYNTAQRIGPQAAHWSTWSGTEGGNEDGVVSTEQANSAPNSMKILTGPGPQDVMLLLGNKTAGHYELKFKMYIATGKGAYYNMQNAFPVGSGAWNFNLHFEANGSGRVTDSNDGDVAKFTYPYDKWFECRHVIDLDNNLIIHYFDGKFVKKLAYTGNLGGIDFFGEAANNTFYVDDVEYVPLPPVVYNVDQCGNAVDLTAYFGQPANVKQTTGLYNNTTATYDPTDPDITCWNEDLNMTPADTVNTSMWYTFTGDGNKYHIETVKCNATNYIGTAQSDVGDTQLAIFEGNCGSLTQVACNDDLYTNGMPDWRAGLDFLTKNGTDYRMLIDGYQFSGVTAKGEFCIEITQIPSITCAQGAVGTYTLDNNGFVCDQQLTGELITLDNASYVIPNIGPVYGLCWAVSVQPLVSGSTAWPPDDANYWGSFGVSPSLTVPNTANDNDPFDQGFLWYFTPVVVAGAVDTVAATSGTFLHELSLTNACFFVGESAQMIMLPALDPLEATSAVTPGPGGAIDLTVTGGLFNLVQDPNSYIVTWTGPNGFTSNDEDITNLAEGSYTAVIHDVTGCIDDYTITVKTTPTTDPKSVRLLTISPNPTNGAFTLNLQLETSADVRVELINTLGQVVETRNAGKVDSIQLPMSAANLSDGSYLLRITAGNETALRRLVVQR